jgi:tellurite resistance protein
VKSELEILKYLHATASDLAEIRSVYGHRPLIREALELFAQFAPQAETTSQSSDSTTVRNDQKDLTLIEASELPREVREDALDLENVRLLRRLRNLAGDGILIGLGELVDRLFPGRQSKRNRTQKMCDALANFGLGMVPDPRDEILQHASQDEVILFDLGQAFDAAADRSETFKLLSLKLIVAAMTARADANVAYSEIELMVSWIEWAANELSSHEQARLRAMVTLLCERSAEFRARRSRFAHLTRDEREALLQAACSVAHADGRIDPRETQVLERIASALELPDQLAHQNLVQLGFGIEDRLGGPSGDRKVEDHPIATDICADTLRITRDESAKAQRVLAAIFAA